MEQSTRNKPIFYAEAAYLVGLLAIALGVAAMEAADFGVSMVVAPAYLIYRKLSLTLPFVTFGMAEYCLQAVLLAVTMLLVRRFRLSWFLTFATAVLYGFLLDGCMALIAPIPHDTFALRLVFYIAGVLLCSVGVSLVFHTYLPPEAYELFVKLVSERFGVNINVFKTCYDIVSIHRCGAVLLLFRVRDLCRSQGRNPCLCADQRVFNRSVFQAVRAFFCVPRRFAVEIIF